MFSVILIFNPVILRLLKTGPLTIQSLPFDVTKIDYFMFWHRRFSHDALSLWMRNLIADILGDRMSELDSR